MLTIRGTPAVSDFRLARLLASLRAGLECLERADTRYVHFVGLERDLTVAETVVLESLLRYGPADSGAEPRGEEHRETDDRDAEETEEDAATATRQGEPAPGGGGLLRSHS